MAQNTLRTLPAELRNTIYDLAFAPDEKNTAVDLRAARPPSKALLLVSRQFYNEANQMYRAAFRAYWRSTSFILDFTKQAGTAHDKHIIAGLECRDVAQITTLKILRDHEVATWNSTTGLWLAHSEGFYTCCQRIRRTRGRPFGPDCWCFDQAGAKLPQGQPDLKEQLQYFIDNA